MHTQTEAQTILAFYFDPGELKDLARKNRKSFLEAHPFPHVVIDDFFPEWVVELLVKEFPGPDDADWFWYGPGKTKAAHNKYIDKLGLSDETKFPPFTRHFMQQLNSAAFVHFLELLTDLPGLITDPSYASCGMHSTGRGGKLMIHADDSRHPNPRCHQRLNLILFINPDWKEAYGGHLELWSRDASRCEKKILPVLNRCVIFDTSSTSYHGHPVPLTCPEGRRRNSLAVYYYTIDRPDDPHYRGFQKINWRPTTPDDFEYLRRHRWHALKEFFSVDGMKRFGKKVLPPILLDGYRYLKRKLEYHT